LCGVRDVKDYRIQTSGQEIITGGSVFNIKTKSLRLGNFTRDEVVELYSQHTQETGQKFTEECFDLIMDYTAGQPWLVNALAREVTSEMRENRDRSITITPALLEEAKERLILSRQTHLDLLVDKLKEDRVKSIILPMILGKEVEDITEDDKEYCIDLGLIKRQNGGIKIANRIYQEIIPRELTTDTTVAYFNKLDLEWVFDDGRINVQNLLTQFREFWNENVGSIRNELFGYREALPQLILFSYLQRIMNGGGRIEREYALGRMRIDVFIKWKYQKRGQYSGFRGQDSGFGGQDSGFRGQESGFWGQEWQYQNIVMELKTIEKNKAYSTMREKALEQTAKYANTCGEKVAYLIIFDKDKSQNWKVDEEIEVVERDGVKIEIWKYI
jgi:hypothetical protein